MNILFIYPKMFHPHRGGIERVSNLLCCEFINRGHNVFFLHNLLDESIKDYPYPAPIFFFPNTSPNLESNGLYYQQFLIEHHIDIVINQDPLSYYRLCRFSKQLKSVHTISVIHSNPLYIYDHLFALTMRLRNNTLLEKIKRIARIIKVPRIKSNYLKELRFCYAQIFVYSDLLCLLSLKFIPELKRVYNVDLQKVIAIGNPNIYSVAESVTCSKKKQLLYVGRIEWYQKRVDRLVYIWKYLYQDFPDWELVIVGDGPIKKDLEKAFSTMERVRFEGYRNPDAYYKDASILCLTSDFEGWPMVLMEAMGFGTIPILYNSYASIADIIEDGETGVLIPPFSRKIYVHRLRELMLDKELRIDMSKKCSSSVDRFNIKHVADQWETAFNRLKNKV